MRLELRGITKRFGSLVANDRDRPGGRAGRDPRLLGENGAGKSTLMNVLYGLTSRTRARSCSTASRGRFAGPGDAMAAGIGMVHQHFMLVPVFTVAENVMLGHEWTPGRSGCLDRRTRPPQGRASSRERYGLAVDPDALVADLPVGVQQRVEILKALLRRRARCSILDEPTAVLTPQETDELIAVMTRAARRRHVDRVHHPQAARGQGDRRPDHGDPPRQGRRHAPTRRRPSSELAATDGRPRGPAGRGQAAGRARRARRSRSADLTVVDDRGQSRSSTTSRFAVRGGEIVAHRRRAGQRPDRADRGAARPAAAGAAARSCSTAPNWPAAVRRRHPRRRRRLRPGGPAARRPGRRLHGRREPGARPLRPRRRSRRGLSLRPGRDRARTPSSGSRSSTSGRRRPDAPAGDAVRRQPAEGRAGPGAVPAAATAGRRSQPTRGRRRRRRWSSSTSGSSPSATRAPRW